MSNITTAKKKLILDHPFFATIALQMEYVEDKSVDTISISRKNIKYNPDFISGLPLDECVGIIAHEVLHYSLLHHVRALGKNLDSWNKACDYAVNPILRKSGFKLPDDHLYDYQFENMDAENIYKAIHKDQKDDENDDSNESDSGGETGDESDGGQPENGEQDENSDSGNGSGQDGKYDENNPQNWGKVEAVDADEVSEAEGEAKQQSAEAMNVAKMAGDIPGNLEEIISDLIEPKKDWKELLQKFVAEVAKNDYNWSMPSKRYMPSGLYLPHLKSIEVGKVVFAIDTSGSVNRELLAEFASELKEAASIFDFPITVIHCDQKIQKVEELDEDTDLTPIGRGGTEFQPVFDYVDENLPETKAIVYFTDGGTWSPPKEPECEVLWIIYENPNYKPEFGEVIQID